MGYVTLQFCFRQPWWQDLAFSWVCLKPMNYGPLKSPRKNGSIVTGDFVASKGDTRCFVKCTPSYHETGITWLYVGASVNMQMDVSAYGKKTNVYIYIYIKSKKKNNTELFVNIHKYPKHSVGGWLPQIPNSNSLPLQWSNVGINYIYLSKSSFAAIHLHHDSPWWWRLVVKLLIPWK